VSKKKEYLHIAILQYGRDKLEQGITFGQLREHIATRGYKESEEWLKTYFWDNYEVLDREYRRNPSFAGVKLWD